MALTSEQREAWRRDAEGAGVLVSAKNILALLDALEEAEDERDVFASTVDALNADWWRAEAALARVEAILAAWDAWDGSPGPDGRTHPDASSPRDRERLRAALSDPEPRDEGGES